MDADWDSPWEYGISAPGYGDGADRVSTPVIISSRNPICRKCRRHQRGWKEVPICECAAPDFDETDFFVGNAFVADPYPYYEHLRSQCPVQREPHHGVVMVTGYEEATSVFHDTATFSSCNSVTGPFPGFPVPLVGDDVGALIEQHRDELPMSDQLPTLDPPVHTAHRALLMRLITPKRLKENEAFMWRLADRQLDEFVANGACEFVSDFATPFLDHARRCAERFYGQPLAGWREP